MAKPPTSVRSVRLPEELWERLKAKAKQRDTTTNNAVAHAVADWIAIPDYVVRAGPALAATAIPTPAQQMTEREARDAFWRKTGAFNPKGKTR